MKMNIVIGSIFAAAMIILVAFVSAVGYQSVQAREPESYSPLFAVRTQRATEKESDGGITAFLGKGKQTSIFPSGNLQQQEMIQSAFRIFSSNLVLLDKLVDNLHKFPAVAAMLMKYGINTMEIKNAMKMIQDDPSLLAEKINDVQSIVPQDDDAQPLGLSTSSALGCFIVAILVIVPVTVVLTLLLLLFTIRILTCLNVNDCANNIANQIADQLIQGLTPG